VLEHGVARFRCKGCARAHLVPPHSRAPRAYTASTRCAACSVVRRPPQPGHPPLPTTDRHADPGPASRCGSRRSVMARAPTICSPSSAHQRPPRGSSERARMSDMLGQTDRRR
jgi:hypothetical protein